MAAPKGKAELPLPQFVVDRIKVWDELKAEADKAAAGTTIHSFESTHRMTC